MRGLLASASGVRTGAGIHSSVEGVVSGSSLFSSGWSLPLTKELRFSWRSRRAAKPRNERKMASWMALFGSLCGLLF